MCPNRLTIRSKVVDAALLDTTRRELLAPATVRYIAEALADALQHRSDERPRALAAVSADWLSLAQEAKSYAVDITN